MWRWQRIHAGLKVTDAAGTPREWPGGAIGGLNRAHPWRTISAVIAVNSRSRAASRSTPKGRSPMVRWLSLRALPLLLLLTASPAAHAAEVWSGRIYPFVKAPYA